MWEIIHTKRRHESTYGHSYARVWWNVTFKQQLEQNISEVHLYILKFARFHFLIMVLQRCFTAQKALRNKTYDLVVLERFIHILKQPACIHINDTPGVECKYFDRVA